MKLLRRLWWQLRAGFRHAMIDLEPDAQELRFKVKRWLKKN